MLIGIKLGKKSLGGILYVYHSFSKLSNFLIFVFRCILEQTSRPSLQQMLICLQSSAVIFAYL